VEIGITVGIEWIKALRENNVESSVALLTQNFPTENLPPASEISFYSPDNNSLAVLTVFVDLRELAKSLRSIFSVL